jgi:tRNA threonylcarbamoyl adenosine modification protein (Sua5/YciO/YrdC/YwlC family)
MLLVVHPYNPDQRKIQAIAKCLAEGGVIIYPTDTVYGLGCDIHKSRAIERVCRIKNISPAKAQFSFVCFDLSEMSQYVKSIATPLYRRLKMHLPGPYTFILPASKLVPRILKNRKSTVGIRIPDNQIARAIVRELGHPIISTSLPGQIVEEYTHPSLIEEKFRSLVDIVVDGGIGGTTVSTVIDCSSDIPSMLRAGLGEWAEA